MKQSPLQSRPAAQRKPPRTALATLLLAFAAAFVAQAQQETSPQQEVARLSQAVLQAQARVEQSQKELADLQRSLQALQQRLGTPAAAGVSAASAPAQPASNREEASASAAGEEPAEREALQQSELATLNQIKVESSSKYPVTLRGMILLNGFVNTAGVDIAPAPSVAIGGAGSTGASIRQTSLGIDARGPVLAGGGSFADLTMDFLGNSAGSIYADGPGLVRLRTAHAGLLWPHTTAFVEFDRPLISPNVPSSLVTIAQPTLAWSGNLWQWTPQAGVAHTVDVGSRQLTVEAAVIDVPDPPTLSSGSTLVSSAESSRWPGAELHMELGGKRKDRDGAIGLGGYLSPHRIPGSPGYNAWAGTLDLRSPQWAGLQLTGSAYRGLALGGLGGGVYKDIVSRQQNTLLVSRPLDDVGGWLQLKQRAGQRLEFNAALGIDQGFASELRAYPLSNTLLYATLARNRTVFANAIWSPSAYLPFSFEYRRITSTPIAGPAVTTNLFGLAAGYVF